ncbi:MAG: DUF748 domain-containing protein [Betaproteobacteria bacterium]|nr:DUF748 domain-containing protein [Betaproteobacteria bacterium]
MPPLLIRLRKPALIMAGVVTAILGFAWLALPGIVQWQAEKYIAEKTGHRLTLARPEINPLALSLRLRELRLVDAAGAPLLGFGELLVDLAAASLSRRAWVFDEIRLDGLHASLVQRQEGGSNWSPLLDALQSKEQTPESKGLPRLDIRRLRVGGAQLEFADRRLTPAFATRIEPLDLELTEVSTLPDDSGKFRLSAKTSFGAQLAWQGDVTLNPLASSGRFDLGEVDLARLAPLLQDKLPIAPPAGIAALGADYRWSRSAETSSLKFEQIALSVSALRLLPVPGAASPQLSVERIAVKDGYFDLDTQQLALGSIQLQGNRLDAVQDKKGLVPMLSLDDIILSEAKLDLGQRQATLAALAIKGGGLSLRRDAQGRIDLPALFAKPGTKSGAKPATPAPAEKTATAEKAAPWRYRIGQATLAGFAVALRDESVAPAIALGLGNIAVAVDGVSENFTAPLPLKASLDVSSGGRLEVSGTLTPADAATDLKVKLANLALKPVQPYVARYAALELVGGRVSAEGRVTRNAKTSGYRGSFAVRDLRLNEAGTQTVFLAWKALATGELELSPNSLGIPLLSLDGLDTKLIIDQDKSTNLKRVLHRQDDAASAVSPAPTPAAAPAASQTATPAAAPGGAAPGKPEPPGFLVNVDRLRFRNGALFFADNSLMLPFGTRIHGLRGSIVGLSSKPGAPGQVELDGEVDEFGLARAVGQADFFHPTDFMDLKVIFRNVEMTHLTPYSATFAGRKINSGKLSLELEYKIKQRQLQGENQIVIDRLELGERVASATAKDLPLDLAIAILSDSDGRIELGLPISGSLDDPQFSYGAIVWKAITNVLTKIITAPFRALGALFGGGEKLDSIAFEAGAARLSPPEREKLLRLVTVLDKRPGLTLAVGGTWSEADRVALQDLQLRRSVAEKSGQGAGEKGDPGPLTTRTPKVQAALESLYGDRFGGAELAALKEGFRKANPGQLEESLTGKMMSRLSGLMREPRSLSESEVGQLKGADFYAVLFERMRAKEVVKDDVLQALATRRAEHALEQLKAAGGPEARLSQGAATRSEATGRDIPLKLEAGAAKK